MYIKEVTDMSKIVKMENYRREKAQNDYFFGQHFEGHGDKWLAIYGNIDEQLISDKAFECIKSGKPVFETTFENKDYSLMAYPDSPPFSLGSLIEVREKQIELVSFYPFMMGIDNEVKLKDFYSWKVNLVEGEFAVETKNDKIINFFDPFYIIDKKNFKKIKFRKFLSQDLLILWKSLKNKNL